MAAHMAFDDPAVQRVFERYEQRRRGDDVLLDATPRDALMSTRDQFLLSVGPEVGWFLHALIIGRRPKRILELGTSYGYSTLFLAAAARSVGATVITMDIADYKQDYAREQLTDAGLAAHVEFQLGDAVAMTTADPGPIDFALLDIWKELYVPCFDALYPKLSDEAIVVSDNMIDPPFWRDDVRAFRAGVRAKPDLHTALLPIGQGIELSVKWSSDNAKL
jgi:predicted O-methyltransferase YrrM